MNGLIMKYKIKRKNHQPAKMTLDRGQGYVIGVVDMCLCAGHVVILIFHSQYSSKFSHIYGVLAFTMITCFVLGLQIKISNASIYYLASLAV